MSIDPSDETHRAHWEAVYRDKPSQSVSWYRPHLETSLRLLQAHGLDATSRVLDVGAGASTLVDDLLAHGVAAITALDLSANALDVARQRLGERAARVDWQVGDITRIDLPEAGFTHWHDRAVLHFLTSHDDARAYAAQLVRAVQPGGCVVIGGFAPQGPERCSGLSVARRSSDEIAHLVGSDCETMEVRHESHRTPWGSDQAFVWVRLRKRD